ncbi:MAG: cytochrome c oxidase subunit 3 [Gammaproteobacteria bacterium]|jgi:cytochrome c oxidase subunit 3|nr:cytochrome c oxidase subunit 3 [Gammaproteobacteria bacterium]MDP6615976.1 cytochrome c oxidase subunit 3 [Gammaproteobacteria bacterium]MDP6694897.1 cytochrome c oxidase subunit 3 [Gammaproteobacteria bacterium]
MSIFKELMDKSWATQGVIGQINDRSAGQGPAARTGLTMLLAVLSSMFLLFVFGYRLRMEEADWVAISDPQILWLNTALLLFSSVAMQRARIAAKQGSVTTVRNNLIMAGVLAIGFLVGQYMAWQELRGLGFYAAGNPATAFFILLTTLHAVHLAGGLLVWSKATVRSWQGMEVKRLSLSVELCTTYWHYLLIVWLVFFTLLLST